jgi:putative FmdB family regulatory protein
MGTVGGWGFILHSVSGRCGQQAPACRKTSGLVGALLRSAAGAQVHRFTGIVRLGGGYHMPIYEYLCKDCHEAFTKTLTIAVHDKESITCPKCGSKNVRQEFTAFYPVTSKKSA